MNGKREEKKITLPKKLQRQMLKFFLKTSIPRIKQEKLAHLSEKSDRGDGE
ncbi:MAG: hypothetical protein FWE90_09010 [Defluviitaleaceae bacterium]|nr:hypothetical protein [Defluviitaleaceae bacterium]